MYKYVIAVVIALALVSCATMQDARQHAGAGFSFDNLDLPSLAEINDGKFEEHLSGDLYRMTNVAPSFDRSFILIHDEASDRRGRGRGSSKYLIKDKQGRTFFDGYFDGIPRYVACVDIDGDNTPDVIVDMAAYGTHAGAEIIEVLLNKNGKLTRLGNPISFEDEEGQESSAGILTWYSSPRFCAIFVGEEADVTGDGTEESPIGVSNIRRVREMWGHKNGELWLISKSSVPIKREEVKYMTFR